MSPSRTLHGLLAFAFAIGLARAQCTTQPLITGIGQGTPGTYGVPTLTSAVPLVNAPYSMRLANGLPNAAGAVIAGVGERPVAIPLFGATLYPDPPIAFPVQLDSMGTARVFALASAPPSLCSRPVVAQGVFVDPLARGGVAFTAAVRARFGGGGGRDLALVALREYPGADCGGAITNLNIVDIVNMTVIRSFSINQEQFDVAVTSNGTYAAVTNYCDRRVVILDMTTDPPTVTAQVSTPMGPEDVDIAAERFALVTDGTDDHRMSSIDLFTGQIVNTITLPIGVESNDASADGLYALVTSHVNDVVRRIDIAPDGTLSDSGVEVRITNPYTLISNVKITPRGDQALVCNNAGKSIEVIDDPAGAMQYRHSVLLPEAPQSLEYHPNGDTAYAYTPATGGVHVLSRAPNGDWSLTATIAVPTSRISFVIYWGVDSLAMMAQGTRLAVHNPPQVTVIDTSTHQVLGSINLVGIDTFPPSGMASIGL